MRVELVFTGTGTTFGVPVIGCDCATCTSGDPHNMRLRCGALLRYGGRVVAVDTSPDFRAQMLAAGESRLDAVLYTHEHADHLFGGELIDADSKVLKGNQRAVRLTAKLSLPPKPSIARSTIPSSRSGLSVTTSTRRKPERRMCAQS